MTAREDAILQVAEKVTNGVAVDWTLENNKTPELGPVLAELETVDRIRVANAALAETADHRTPPPEARGARRPLFTWGKLEVLEWLGEGTFGEVYRVYDPALQTELALKLRKAQASGDDPEGERFLSEARRLARVRHPNVLVVYGVETHDGRAGIWTEFLRGETLESCLEEQGTWNGREAALVGVDICRALAAVHAAGLIHRDVKTMNVIREKGGRIVLMDFGSGGELPRTGDVGKSRHIHGTPVAMAPEQLRGEVAGPATDIYGLGVLLYRLVTDSYPIEADSIGELVERHSRGERKPIRDRRPDLSSEFIQVVERALEPKPSDRYASAGAMEQALLGTLDPAGRVGTLGPRGRDPSRGRRWRHVGSGVLAAVAVVLLVWVLGQRQDPLSTQKSGVPVRDGAMPHLAQALTATASLYRHAASGDERLLPGARVSLGDRLFLSLEGPDTMFVYVLNEDQAGHIYVLFPIRGLSPENPLTPGRRYRLPDRLGDRPAYWDITSTGGKETVIAIASRAPLSDVEREIERFPRAEVGRRVTYRKIKPSVVQSLRGIGGLSAEPQPETGTPHRISDALKALAERERGADGPWIWQVDLENQ